MVDRYSSMRGMQRNSTCNNRASCGIRGNNSVSRSSCGGCSSCSEKGDCSELKKKLKLVDFSLIDTVLYLDAYPDCKAALAYYHKLKAEREMLVEALSKSCNMPVTNFDNASEDTWDWVNTPWPWEACSN